MCEKRSIVFDNLHPDLGGHVVIAYRWHHHYGHSKQPYSTMSSIKPRLKNFMPKKEDKKRSRYSLAKADYQK
jgi:hypothetical protein